MRKGKEGLMPDKEIKKYDLIFSLGGNCAAAHNLRFRNLRRYSLPFDWTFITDEKALYNLAEGFMNGFREFMLYDNLQELSEDEEKQVIHPDSFHYKDVKTGFYYVNHFHNDIRTTDEYDNVKKVFEKRVKRFTELINSSRNILMILSTSFYVSQNAVEDFYTAIKKLYPDKTIDIITVCFGCNANECIELPNIQINRYNRNINTYDVLQTNFEWAFLDDIKLTKKIRNKIMFKIFGYRVKIHWSK